MSAPGASGSGKRQRTFTMKGDQEGATGKKPLTGYLTTFMHLVKGYIGTGIFNMGEAFKNSGIIFGPLVLGLLALINLNCQHMLVAATVKVAEEEEEDVKPTYAETVEYTMESSSIPWCQRNSRALGIITNMFLIVSELGFCCVYFLFVAKHFVEISVNHGFLPEKQPTNDHIMLAIILVPMWLSTFLGNLKLLMPLSLIANILMWLGITAIYYFTIRDIKPNPKLNYIASYDTIPLFVGVALYSFEGITFIINLRNEMKKPEQFVTPCGVLNTGMILVCLLVTSVGILSYWCYAEKIKSSVFQNFPPDEILTEVTLGLVAVGVLFTFTLHMYIAFELSYPIFYNKYGPFKHSKIIMAVYRSVPVLLTYILANVIPFLGLFISLVGAATGAVLAFIFPPALELVAFKDELKLISKIKCWAIICLGFIAAIAGTALSIYQIVKEFQEEYGSKKEK